jgi:hypothetical protein
MLQVVPKDFQYLYRLNSMQCGDTHFPPNYPPVDSDGMMF